MGHHNSATFLFCLLLGYFLPELAAQLSKDEQDYCVSFSNNLRSTVATGNQQNKGGGNLLSATNMLELAYNETIGQTAQAWADKCQFSHSNTAGLGENIYWSTKEEISNTEALNKAMVFWWNEAVTIGIPENLVVDANNFEPIGHFTQYDRHWLWRGQMPRRAMEIVCGLQLLAPGQCFGPNDLWPGCHVQCV
ncbi:hypothetical protein niasHT_033957 [Heterodera trifolii]|uniref:SCP domain-containing protein n=1 Tax=Heterodera trifolii TaxID=157864 RepID=A0ABD2IAP6_9BILA